MKMKNDVKKGLRGKKIKFRLYGNLKNLINR